MLERGAKIQAKLIEKIDSRSWIVSFEGQLLQVKNSTPLAFESGQWLNLRVEQVDPLRLKILESQSKNKSSMDILV